MRELAALPRQHRVGGVAGDDGALAEDHVADVQDDRLLGELLEDSALVEQGPDKAVVLVVGLVPALVPAVLVAVHGDVVRLVVLIHYVFG